MFSELLILESDSLRVAIHPKGAELQSVYDKGRQVEYLWQGDPAFWAKRSPVLFPIVGTLKNNTYFVEGRSYELGRHGFARDHIFQPEQITAHRAVFVLKDSPATKINYPFQFRFQVEYELADNILAVTYRVINPDEQECLFSVGGHPAFRVPLMENEKYDDYYLEFEKNETVNRWPISADGLIENESIPFLKETKRIQLTKELFSKDAIVLKQLQSKWVRLASDRHLAGIQFHFEDFPYLGLWAAKDADFVCIEPWCGIADSVNSSQILKDKEGIVHLPAHEEFSRTWKLQFENFKIR